MEYARNADMIFKYNSSIAVYASTLLSTDTIYLPYQVLWPRTILVIMYMEPTYY